MTIKQIYRKGIVKSIKELFDKGSTTSVGPELDTPTKVIRNFFQTNILKVFAYNDNENECDIANIYIPYDFYQYLKDNYSDNAMFEALEDAVPCITFWIENDAKWDVCLLTAGFGGTNNDTLFFTICSKDDQYYMTYAELDGILYDSSLNSYVVRIKADY